MSEKGGKVTIDAEEYLKLLDEMADLEKRLRSLGSQGFSSKDVPRRASAPVRESPKDEEPMVLELDISGIEWQTKDKQPAGPDAAWCWAFSTTKDGGIRRESMQLVQALEQYGTVIVGRYEISLGGREGNLLNRKLKK